MSVGWLWRWTRPGPVHGLWQPITFSGFEVTYEPNAPGWFDHVSEDTQSAGKYYENVLTNGIGSGVECESWAKTQTQRTENFLSIVRPIMAEMIAATIKPIFICAI